PKVGGSIPSWPANLYAGAGRLPVPGAGGETRFMADKIKFVLAGLLLVAGLAAFYYYSDLPLVARVGMVLAGVVAGVAVGLSSEPGKRLARFIGESREELRKVVWPTRKESFQT